MIGTDYALSCFNGGFWYNPWADWLVMVAFFPYLDLVVPEVDLFEFLVIYCVLFRDVSSFLFFADLSFDRGLVWVTPTVTLPPFESYELHLLIRIAEVDPVAPVELWSIGSLEAESFSLSFVYTVL